MDHILYPRSQLGEIEQQIIENCGPIDKYIL